MIQVWHTTKEVPEAYKNEKRNWPTAYRACTESKAKECWLARGGLENLMKAGLAGWLALVLHSFF